MGRFRVTLAGLMGVVIVLGVGLAALKNASEEWAGAVRLMTLGMLATSILGAGYSRGARRAWWLGFALVGWGYEALASAPWSSPQTLPSHTLLDVLYATLSPRQVVTVESIAAADMSDKGRVLAPRPTESADTETAHRYPGASEVVVVIGTLEPLSFRAIGHHLLALAAAVLGGFIAGRFQASQGPVEPTAPAR
jgi:hypothetical protein